MDFFCKNTNILISVNIDKGLITAGIEAKKLDEKLLNLRFFINSIVYLHAKKGRRGALWLCYGSSLAMS